MLVKSQCPTNPGCALLPIAPQSKQGVWVPVHITQAVAWTLSSTRSSCCRKPLVPLRGQDSESSRWMGDNRPCCFINIYESWSSCCEIFVWGGMLEWACVLVYISVFWLLCVSGCMCVSVHMWLVCMHTSQQSQILWDSSGIFNKVPLTTWPLECFEWGSETLQRVEEKSEAQVSLQRCGTTKTICF